MRQQRGSSASSSCGRPRTIHSPRGDRSYYLGGATLWEGRSLRSLGCDRAGRAVSFVLPVTRSGLPLCDWYFGLFAIAEGRLADAAASYEQSLRDWLVDDIPSGEFKPMVGLADVAAAVGLHEHAARLLGAVDQILETTDGELQSFDLPGGLRASDGRQPICADPHQIRRPALTRAVACAPMSCSPKPAPSSRPRAAIA